jgi:acetyltransferase-like isoleucine patch superfamily enzyme
VIDSSARVHLTADLEADLTVGPRTAIWHRAQIRAGAHIGADAIIGRDVFIDEGVRLGDRVKVQNGALIYHGVTVGDDVFIGPGAILTNDRRPRAFNEAGRLARTTDWTVTSTSIQSGASIGAGAVIVAGSDVGRYAMVGAGAVLTRPVPSHGLVVGNPARQIGWVCTCAERLVADEGSEHEFHCAACDRRFVGSTADDGLEEVGHALEKAAPA